MFDLRISKADEVLRKIKRKLAKQPNSEALKGRKQRVLDYRQRVWELSQVAVDLNFCFDDK